MTVHPPQEYIEQDEKLALPDYRVTFRTFQSLTDTIRGNIHNLPRDIDLVIGIPRSGMIPAYMLALFLNKPACSLPEFIKGVSFEHGFTQRAMAPITIHKVLVVDDSIHSGASLAKAKQKLLPFSADYVFEYAAIYARTSSKCLVDYYFEIIDSDRIFQWNYLNHAYASRFCYDFDGVLCVDPTDEENDDGANYEKFLENAKPLYIPGYKIYAIVTARPEKYRPQTEAWLKKHNVLYETLYMMDVTSAEERRKLGNHAGFKAEIYRKLDKAICFIESDPRQAKEIAKLSGKRCICVKTDEYFVNTSYNLLEQSLAKLEQSLAKAETQLSSLYHSRSWRITRPLRIACLCLRDPSGAWRRIKDKIKTN